MRMAGPKQARPGQNIFLPSMKHSIARANWSRAVFTTASRWMTAAAPWRACAFSLNWERSPRTEIDGWVIPGEGGPLWPPFALCCPSAVSHAPSAEPPRKATLRNFHHPLPSMGEDHKVSRRALAFPGGQEQPSGGGVGPPAC
jgi:hypothetical protein